MKLEDYKPLIIICVAIGLGVILYSFLYYTDETAHSGYAYLISEHNRILFIGFGIIFIGTPIVCLIAKPIVYLFSFLIDMGAKKVLFLVIMVGIIVTTGIIGINYLSDVSEFEHIEGTYVYDETYDTPMKCKISKTGRIEITKIKNDETIVKGKLVDVLEVEEYEDFNLINDYKQSYYVKGRYSGKIKDRGKIDEAFLVGANKKYVRILLTPKEYYHVAGKYKFLKQ